MSNSKLSHSMSGAPSQRSWEQKTGNDDTEMCCFCTTEDLNKRQHIIPECEKVWSSGYEKYGKKLGYDGPPICYCTSSRKYPTCPFIQTICGHQIQCPNNRFGKKCRTKGLLPESTMICNNDLEWEHDVSCKETCIQSLDIKNGTIHCENIRNQVVCNLSCNDSYEAQRTRNLTCAEAKDSVCLLPEEHSSNSNLIIGASVCVPVFFIIILIIILKICYDKKNSTDRRYQVVNNNPMGQDSNHTTTGQDSNHTPTGQEGNHTPTAQDSNHTPTAQDSNHTPTGPNSNHTPTGPDSNHTPTGQDSNHTPTDQDSNHTPTGQDSNHTPTGQGGNHTPTAQDSNHTPTGPDSNHTPTGQDSNHTPTGQDGNHTPTGQEGNHTPTAQDSNHTPTAQDGNQIQNWYDNSSTLDVRGINHNPRESGSLLYGDPLSSMDYPNEPDSLPYIDQDEKNHQNEDDLETPPKSFDDSASQSLLEENIHLPIPETHQSFEKLPIQESGSQD